MALIGTISGSVGPGGSLVSATAISGTLVIADAPAATFPKLTGGVKYLVSGSKNVERTDNPEFLFNVDVFHSGAVGSDQYMQFKPVNTLQIPTNTTASYIYTSGSTNDLYFTQYSGPYTNTTRLRWLEGMLTTGLLHGGVLSTATGSTTFSITSGSGIILSYNASVTTDPYPTINYVQWPAHVSQSLTYVTSSLLTYIGVNASGGIIQQNSPFTLATDSDYITIGRVLHQSGSVTIGVSTQPLVSYGNNHWQDDFMRALGPLKVSGHILAASGSTLGITKTAGDSYVIGRNYTTDPNNPNNISSATDTAVTVSKIYRAYVSGSTLRLDTNTNNTGYTDINPAQYNNNGTLASVGASEASIQRVYWYPNTVSRAFTVYYGSAVYADPPGGTNALDVAQQNIASENFVEGENTAGAAILVGYILALGSATNLSDAAQARFIQAGVSRGAGAGGGGGVAVGATSAAGLDTYVQFNDGGSTFGGDAGLTYNKTTDTLTIAGDLAVNGGDLTTTATAFNLVNSTATTVNLGGGASAVNIGAAGSATTFAGNLTGSNLLLTNGFVVTGSGIIESNTSTSALRVTQQGSGNAITVEDSINPDSTPFVVAADGKVGIGIATPTAYLFVSGADATVPALVARAADVTVNTLSITGSGGAGTGIGFVNIDQGNYSNKYALTITNVGSGTAGFKVTANSTGVGLALDNMNTTPQFSLTHKNLWFNSVSTAFDTSQVTYKFIENNKAATYPNQKTFLISGNTNGPKTGSYFEVEKSGSAGSIKILELQGDTTDNSLFVSGSILSSGSIFVAGDLAVSGGDITTTATTFNLITGSATTVNFAQTANTLNIGKLTGNVVISSKLTGSSPVLFGDTVTIGGPSQAVLSSSQTTASLFNTVATTLNIGGAATTLTLGASSGRTTISNDLAITTGNIIGAPGSGANVMTLISSGNIIAKLDVDASAEGHKFAVQDSRGIDQFWVGENGNAELSGSLVVTGSTTVGTIIENLINSVGSTGTTTFDTSKQGIFYVNGPAGSITANFTNVPTTNLRVITPTVILSQSGTPQSIIGVQIDGAAQTPISWANGVTPIPSANKQDIYGFSLIRSGSAWKVLGQLSTYG